MKVAMVSEHASPLAVLGGVDAGGQNVHVAALASAMGRRGVDVVVHTRRESATLARRVPLAPGVMVDHIEAGPARPVPKDDLFAWMGAFAHDLRRQWSADRPDVVHAHFWMSGWAALAAAGPLGIPVVQTFHALGVVKQRHQGAGDTSPWQRQGVESEIVARADHIVATCTDELFELRRLGASAGAVSVVPCGVDVGLFSPAGPAEDRPSRRPRIVVVSRLVPRKGIGNVVEAMARVPDAELVVAGGPLASGLAADPEAGRLWRLAAEHGVSERVILRGRVEDAAALPSLLRSADVVACVPWYEPFGIVPLEAMACGIPVVASAVGGLVDTVVDGVTGIHVPARRADLVAAALRWLLNDDQRRRAMGAAGAQRARRHYRWERVAAATMDVYRPLLQRSRAMAERA